METNKATSEKIKSYFKEEPATDSKTEALQKENILLKRKLEIQERILKGYEALMQIGAELVTLQDEIIKGLKPVEEYPVWVSVLVDILKPEEEKEETVSFTRKKQKP